MFPERRAVIKFFFQESKCEVFFGTFKLVYYFEYQAVTQEVFAVSGCKILRTIQETRFESFKLKPVDKKVPFLADFRSKTNF
jgi:hypothetical protein